MSGYKLVWGVVACIIGALVVLAVFFSLVLPRIESPTVSGLVGAVIGSLAGLLGSIATAFVSVWKVSRDAEEKLKDRISNHALQLTQMDYELRQKSLELTGTQQLFLAPAKVYRTFYRALLELHTTDEWPREVEELGLLNIFALGPQED